MDVENKNKDKKVDDTANTEDVVTDAKDSNNVNTEQNSEVNTSENNQNEKVVSADIKDKAGDSGESDVKDFEKRVIGIKKSDKNDGGDNKEPDSDTYEDAGAEEDDSIISAVKGFVRARNDEDESEDENDEILTTPVYSEDGKNEKKSGSKRGMNRIILLIVISFLVLVMAFVLLGLNEVFSCFKSGGKDVKVEIPSGSSVTTISNMLHESGVVDYPWMFSAYAGARGNSIKSGSFQLNTVMDYDTIYKTLSDSSNSTSKGKLVITEGMDLFNISAKADSGSVIKGEDIIKELNNKENYSKYNFANHISDSELSNSYYQMEGFCAPDTFYVDSSSDAKTVANTILKETDSNLAALYGDVKASGMSLWQVMTLASMIQAEIHSESEMANISSVLHNRLNNTSEFPKLQCDPTYKYATKIKEDMGKKGTVDNAKADSYDTYTCKGLPAGSICNPSMSAIKAALHPSNTNYYFFCADLNTGEVLYATTFEEHKNNINKLEAK